MPRLASWPGAAGLATPGAIARRALLAAVVTLLLFLSTLASASPSLHGWLHADHQSPSHYCFVTMLEHGQSDAVNVWVALPLPAIAAPATALPVESFFVSHDTNL